MSAFDDLKHKGQDMMNNPETREKIEQMAKDKNISVDEAKERFMKHGDQ